MTVMVFSDGFQPPYSHVNHPYRPLPVTVLDLARGVITAGKSGWANAFEGGWARIWEMGCRYLETKAYVTTSHTNLCLTDLYRSLDGSEKGMASYRFGMSLAKLVSERELHVPWLLHVDPLVASGVVTLTAGTKERGDMVGHDAAPQWHVVEAKGRSHTPPLNFLTDAKAQASRVQTVSGTTPATHCACVADLSMTPFYVDFLDPKSPDDAAMSLGLEANRFLEEYYSLITDLIAARSPFVRVELAVDGSAPVSFMVTNIIPGQLALGVHETVYRWLSPPETVAPTEGTSKVREDRPQALYDFAKEWQSAWDGLSRSETYSVGLDGYILLQCPLPEGVTITADPEAKRNVPQWIAAPCGERPQQKTSTGTKS